MKKIYKPLARTEKASQMFKKKTLNVNDNLNIKHDEDDIENVEDYWNTAVSVIGNSTIDSIDHSVLAEVSDTLFNINNIRKSIRNSNNKEKQVQESSDIEEDNDTLVQPWNNINKEKVNVENAVEEIVINKENTHAVHEGKAIKENSNAVEDGDIIDVEIDDTNIIDMESTNNNDKSKNVTDNVTSDNLMYDDIEFGLDYPDDDVNSDEMAAIDDFIDCENPLIKKFAKSSVPDEIIEKSLNEAIQSIGSQPNKKALTNSPSLVSIDVSSFETEFSKNQIKSTLESENKNLQMGVLKSFSRASGPQTAKAVEKSVSKKATNKSFMIEQALKPTKNNVISPLVCSNSIDTALMTLDYLAYFDDFKTANSFSIFVIKGKVSISVNGKSKIAVKGDVAIVEKEDLFSLECMSVNGAKLLLSYAL